MVAIRPMSPTKPRVLGKRMTPDELARSGSEHGHQRAYFSALSEAQPAVYAATFAIPNGRKRAAADAGMLKAEGVKAGVPDVFVSWPVAPYAGLFLEFKKPADADKRKTAGSTQDNQDVWIAGLRSRGFAATHVFGWREAMEVTALYFRGEYRNSPYASR